MCWRIIAGFSIFDLLTVAFLAVDFDCNWISHFSLRDPQVPKSFIVNDAGDSRRSLGKKVPLRTSHSNAIGLMHSLFRDAWRYQGMFSTWERFRPKHTIPGLGIGTGAFIIYLAYDFLVSKPSHGRHVAAHGETSHH